MTIDSKAAIPYGDNFDLYDPVTLNDYYNYNPTGSGQQVFRNRLLGPVDSVNNPNGLGYMADLLQGSDDPTKLTVNYGVRISYNMAYPLVEGTTYTISCWIKPIYLNSSANISVVGSGNWTIGLQTAGSEGNFSDPSWGFFNGTVSIINSQVTGTLSTVGDLGIPKDIPLNEILFARRGDHIRAIPSVTPDSTVLIRDAANNGSYMHMSDIAASPYATILLKDLTSSVFIYQSIIPLASVASYSVDAWIRIAQETIIGSSISVNYQLTGGITGYALIWKGLDGNTYIEVYKSYLTLDTTWRLERETLTAANTLGVSTSYWTRRDTTQPVGYGFFITGDLAIYGGIRIQDNSTINGPSSNTNINGYVRVHNTFVANMSMQNTFMATPLPGNHVNTLPFSSGYITITIYCPQAAQPVLINYGATYQCGVKLNDGTVFLVPSTKTHAQTYDPVTQTLATSNVNFPTSSNLVNGSIAPNYVNGVLLQTNKVFLIPYTCANALIYDPSTDSTFIPNGIYPVSTTSHNYRCGIVLLDGRVYMPPFATNLALLYDPVANTLVTSNSTGYISGNAINCVLLDSGKVLIVPNTAAAIQIYDPISDTLTYIGSARNDASNYSYGIKLLDGRVFLVPAGNTSRAIIYDPGTNTVTSPTGVYSNFGTFNCASVLQDGRVFIPPLTKNVGLIYDPVYDTLSSSNCYFPGNSTYEYSISLNDGTVLIVPYNTITGLIYDPSIDSLIQIAPTFFSGVVSNPTYSPWCPKFASVSLYGLFINEGTTPLPYIIDLPTLSLDYLYDTAPSTFKSWDPITTPLGDVLDECPLPALNQPNHSVGINMTGNIWYGTALIFLNLAKLGSFSRYRPGTDPLGIFKAQPMCGWRINWQSGWTFDTTNSRLGLRGVFFASGNSYFNVPLATNGSWSSFNTGWPDKSLVTGPHIPNGMVITGSSIDTTNSALVRFTTSIPFTTNSSDDPTVATSLYEIKRFAVDSYTYLNLNNDGYPTTIPNGYIPFGLISRQTPIGVNSSGMLNPPFLPSGLYVLKWDGIGTARLDIDVFLRPTGFPCTLVSSTSNRAVYNVDCSGNTSTGQSTILPYFLSSDANAGLSTQAQLGFVVCITSTDPVTPLTNLRLVEARYEDLMDSGELFYPSWIDRAADFQTIRFLDWTSTNRSAPFVADITQIPTMTEISWTCNVSHTPWQVIIELCNRTLKNCWINLHPSSPDDIMTWIAELFRDNLDPRLRIYLEYGNEPWNGNMTGYYFTQYATHFNLNVNPSSSNPPWDNQEAAYAICSQHAWTIWESVFSGPRGLLSPPKLTVDPKQQDRRLVRLCSVNQGGISNAQDIFRYAQPYCTNPYGIPYDAICSNWYISMLSSAETVVELSTAPNSYPWTLDQLIPLCYLEATSQLEGCSSTHKQCMTDNFIDYTGAHQGIGSFLGFDKDGQLITPAYCLYEGGWGSPGPSQYMLYCIIQLRFEVDGQDTVYNIYKQSFDWWAKEVALETSDKNKKIMMMNLWETPKPWGHPDQWGIVDKSIYSSPEYQGFPVPRAVSYSAGNLPTSSSRSAAVSNPNNPSQPYCLVGSSWQRLVNIYIINESGQWQLVPASIIEYLGTDNEFH